MSIKCIYLLGNEPGWVFWRTRVVCKDSHYEAGRVTFVRLNKQGEKLLDARWVGFWFQLSNRGYDLRTAKESPGTTIVYTRKTNELSNLWIWNLLTYISSQRILGVVFECLSWFFGQVSVTRGHDLKLWNNAGTMSGLNEVVLRSKDIRWDHLINQHNASDTGRGAGEGWETYEDGKDGLDLRQDCWWQYPNILLAPLWMRPPQNCWSGLPPQLACCSVMACKETLHRRGGKHHFKMIFIMYLLDA